MKPAPPECDAKVQTTKSVTFNMKNERNGKEGKTDSRKGKKGEKLRSMQLAGS
jgi:hypothetical protein